jgi:hypothetical protein
MRDAMGEQDLGEQSRLKGEAKLEKGDGVKARSSQMAEVLGEGKAQGRSEHGLHLTVLPRDNGLLPGGDPEDGFAAECTVLPCESRQGTSGGERRTER